MRRGWEDENNHTSSGTGHKNRKRVISGDGSRNVDAGRKHSKTGRDIKGNHDDALISKEINGLADGTLILKDIWHLAKYLHRHPQDSTHSKNDLLEWSPAQSQLPTRLPDNPSKKMNHQKTHETMVINKNEKNWRRSLMERGLKTVEYNHEEDLIFAEQTLRGLVEADPRLHGLKRSFRMFMGQSLLERHRIAILDVWKDGEKTTQNDKLKLTQPTMMKALGPYTPPVKRVLVTENLTKNQLDPIPVYSDLVGETEINLIIPDSLLYVYGDQNLIGEETDRELQEINNLSQKISCNCCSQKPLIPCWTNTNCDCTKVAKALTTSHKKYVHPLESNDVKLLHESNAIDFSCSEDCACKGNCTNNALLTIERKLLQFEVFKQNDIIGYSIRSLNAIPAGTPVFEFTGELVRSDLMDHNDLDYAIELDLARDVKDFCKYIRGCPEANWTDDLHKEYKKIAAKDWMINPKWYGNAARTCAHSCDPNLMTVKVFQKSLTPSCVHLVLVANRDIFPGTELSIDYGTSYNWGNGFKCQCGSLACVQSPFEALEYNTEQSVNQIEEYLACRQAKGFLDYKKLLANIQ